MEIEDQLRKMARSSYWQSLYRASQKCNGVCVFENNTNFSGLQVKFLYWLSIYEMLYTELTTHEDDFLTEAVIEDDVRTDAYLVHRNNKQDFLWKKHRQQEKDAQLQNSKKRPFKRPGKVSTINVKLKREE